MQRRREQSLRERLENGGGEERKKEEKRNKTNRTTSVSDARLNIRIRTVSSHPHSPWAVWKALSSLGIKYHLHPSPQKRCHQCKPHVGRRPTTTLAAGKAYDNSTGFMKKKKMPQL